LKEIVKETLHINWRGVSRPGKRLQIPDKAPRENDFSPIQKKQSQSRNCAIANKLFSASSADFLLRPLRLKAFRRKRHKSRKKPQRGEQRNAPQEQPPEETKSEFLGV
jgi:hypothetical protein